MTTLSLAERITENVKCIRSLEYFCDNHVKVMTKELSGENAGTWAPFKLWEGQRPVAKLLQESHKLCALKARQLGLSWFAIARILQQSIFHPNSLCLMYSYRDNESCVLKDRLTLPMADGGGMYEHLPEWMQIGKIKGNAHVAMFPNGSVVRALPTSAGDSYTASIVLVDEADIVPNLSDILRRVKPTIDNGGQLILVSRPNKDKPDSTFKRIYKSGKEGTTDWVSVFLPWNVHPGRDAAWYAREQQESLTNTGSLDYLYEQYPATDVEALAARELSKRIPPKWLEACFDPLPLQLDNLPAGVPGLKLWEYPEKDQKYVISCDVAEGKETSDDSATVVLNKVGRQVAEFHGKIEIEPYSEMLIDLAAYFNRARILVERNNHGHAVITRLKDRGAKLMHGRDGRDGYISDARGKAEMYAAVAERLKNRETTLRSQVALYQLMSIERSTLRAPEGLLDDVADAYAIGCVALDRVNKGVGSLGLI